MTKAISPPLHPSVFTCPVDRLQFKELLRQKHDELNQKFDPQQPVTHLLVEKANFIDDVLRTCWKFFLGKEANRLCLAAVGGYGRNELFPNSDIDILVLIDSEPPAHHQTALADFFNFLWDIGLKPGQSTRTVDECFQAAIGDQTVMTSLLELRLIDGNEQLCKELKTKITSKKIWPSDQFFLAKMDEQEMRYAKFHETAYNLEPNIKEGPGGLRDMQVIAWVFKRHYDSATLKELIQYGFLPESEYNALISAQQTLWRLRYALHVLTDRCEDRLLFDYQRELAKWFGFNDNEDNQDVEQFMQHYYKTVVGLEQLNEMLLQLFSERFIPDHKTSKTTPINAYFKSVKGYIEAAHENVFQQRPLALLEVFLLQQQNTSLKGIRATTIRLIRKNLDLINDDFRNNQNARRLFIEILRQPRGITHALRRMNRYGVLAAYLPPFANIVARMQYDLFHIYTVDAHTLFVVRNLRRFSLEKHNTELPFCNKIALLVSKPDVLYIAALFHDIAKGKGGDHSTAGEQIARDFCVGHELSSHDTKLITWLVRNHLIMSMTAQRKDISDPDVIHNFATQVGTIEYLNYLYLLTVADIRATNPALWNSWKDSLLKELYTATFNALHRGLGNPIALAEKLKETKNEAINELIKLGISKSTINKSWDHANDDFFLRYSVEEIVWHTIAIASSNESEFPLVLLRPQTQRGSAEIFLYTKNEDHIFSLSTAILDQLGLTILDARIVTTTDQYVLNSFQVLEQSGDPITDLYREIHICSTLRKYLIQRKFIAQRNLHRLSRQARHFPIPTRISFHEDPQNKYTILELITTDRAGLLSQIGKAFRQQNIQLYSAKITTIGSRAEDMFYILDYQNKLIKDPEKRRLIHDEILANLNVTGNAQEIKVNKSTNRP